MKTRGFEPEEIIFSVSTACNLHCEHCFINREPKKLDIEEALAFLKDCAAGGMIQKVGFTGGEPFLYMDFLLSLTKEAVMLDLLFDQIMTNGDWWKDETELRASLQKLYEAGYDGKIGLSWDSYHGQSEERMNTFINAVNDVFGENVISIQTVEGEKLPLESVPVYNLPRTYQSNDKRAWNSKKWFKEDYCHGPGNILFVHADGNIAPCCGFANENPQLFIGRITDSYETIMNNARQNKMVNICFSEGLSHYRKHKLKKQLKACGKKIPGKTADICSFCDFICSQKLL